MTKKASIFEGWIRKWQNNPKPNAINRL